LTIVDENENVQVIEVTDGHPFWVVTDEPDLERAAREIVDENGVILYHENLEPGLNGFWVEAKDLREGDIFLGANGELVVLISTERVEFEESIKVYNFTVDGNHNYFVIAETDDYGQTSVLVHNAQGYDKLKLIEKSKQLIDKIPKFNIGQVEFSPKLKPLGIPSLPWKDYGNRLSENPFFSEFAKIAKEIFAKFTDIRLGISIGLEGKVKLGQAILSITPGVELPSGGKPSIFLDFRLIP
jgi:hypothetical protein